MSCLPQLSPAVANAVTADVVMLLVLVTLSGVVGSLVVGCFLSLTHSLNELCMSFELRPATRRTLSITPCHHLCVQESEEAPAAQILYPAMQCADVFFLGVRSPRAHMCAVCPVVYLLCVCITFFSSFMA